jgi:rsbT antagonist protein RsbS
MDSVAARILRSITQVVRLVGAEAIVAGIQPDVALAMVQLGLTMEGTATALDREEGLAQLLARDPQGPLDAAE